jgi:hypothetical protein
MPGLVPKFLDVKLNTSYISPKCKKVLFMPVSLQFFPHLTLFLSPSLSLSISASISLFHSQNPHSIIGQSWHCLLPGF